MFLVSATKGSPVDPMVKNIDPLMGSESVLTTIHNGPGTGERIAQHIVELIADLMQTERMLSNADPSILLD